MRAFVTTCSNRLSHLTSSLPCLVDQKNKTDKIVVVTQNDQESSNFASKFTSHIVTNDGKPYFDKVDNLQRGVSVAQSIGCDQVVLIDCDTILRSKIESIGSNDIAFCIGSDRDLTGFFIAPTNETFNITCYGKRFSRLGR